MSRCAIERCEARTKPGHLMCREHWFLVPLAARREVTESWRDVRRGGAALDFTSRMARYRAAVKAAVDSVNAKYLEAASPEPAGGGL